jgi:phosphate transport system permease protein
MRRVKDLLAKYMIGVGGLGVIAAVALIFFYLVYVVFPLFLSGSLEVEARYPSPAAADSETMLLAMEEQAEIAVRFDDRGRATFFSTADGRIIDGVAAALPPGAVITSFSAADPASRIVAYGLDDGSAVVLRHNYKVSYPNNIRTITPFIDYPLGQEPIVVDEQARPLSQLAIQNAEDQAMISAVTADGELLLTDIQKEVSFLSDAVEIEVETTSITSAAAKFRFMLLDKMMDVLYLATPRGEVTAYDVNDPGAAEALETVNLLQRPAELTSFEFLTGDISILAGDSQGNVSQWFPVKNADGMPRLTHIRDFKLATAAITSLATEHARKGFLAVDRAGRLGIFHSTADQTILTEQLSDVAAQQVTIGPRANAAIVENAEDQLIFVRLHNEHPEVSWSSLWGKVWYESYDEPAYVWQSSSASSDFEPKLSLVPISFGTIKAAFYAMLFAIPLAIFGAIYTAYFMTPKMRSMVKPTIEIMEALPTVILGFLAGLWLAPLMEEYLPAMLALLLLLPLAVVGASYAWHKLPPRIHNRVSDGWLAALLIPLILLVSWLCFAINHPLEAWLFGGDTQLWLDRELGVSFDQRNSLVVGIAMGFAVIPTIFSITEDAIFGVPRHLTNGSLALGATPWQTLTRVVILTASPGIFSAVMIGFGRAVGETMIVLMATGNTPVMDFSIFQGMRTLSANIAVEMPESEVDSTHYRVLFLAALVLFMFTFFFNTIAEVVRQRLRKKYSSL